MLNARASNQPGRSQPHSGSQLLSDEVSILQSVFFLFFIRNLYFYIAVMLVSYTNDETNQVCARINRTLRRSFKLRKIDLSFNFLRTRLYSLLRGLVQPIEYLNLQDCRLDASDVAFLTASPMLATLRTCKELNLSMNDFSQTYQMIATLIGNCTQLNCLSISYCQIPIEAICHDLVGQVLLDTTSNPSSSSSSSSSAAASTADQQLDTTATRFSKLKMIQIQPYTPPKIHEIIDILHAFSRIKSLEKFGFLPSLYAFPGTNDYEREKSAIKVIQICNSILESKGRSDIEFTNQYQ